MHSGKTRIDRLGRAALAVAILSCWPTANLWAQSTQAPDVRSAFNIPAGSLAVALDQFSRQGGIQTLSQVDQLAGKQVGAISGQMTWQEALSRLLKGSGLEYQQINATTVVIRPAESGPKPKSRPAAAPTSKPVPGNAPKVTEIQAVTVTGTRIRGGETPSPVITIGQENFQEEGLSDLGEVIRSVPQNFRGGQNPGVGLDATQGAGGLANQNITGGSGLNLRGLGPDASLTLLNGRRLAYGGFSQAVDISAIPIEAVDRVEIVADGASAIYGSDAVAGVGNVVLKRDFDGVTLSSTYGSATEGGLTTRDYDITAGTTWSTGGLIVTYKDASNDPIYASQRSYTGYLRSPTTIYPESKLRSGLISLHQSLGDAVELHLDALRTRREQLSYSYYDDTSPLYSRFTSSTTTSFVAPSIEISLPRDWTISLGGAWGKDKYVQHEWDITPPTTVLAAEPCYCNQSRAYEASAEGPLFAVNGEDARLAVGVGYRKNEFDQQDYLSNAVIARGKESSRFAYTELNVPLISPSENLPGARRLTLTAAIRTENYTTFGRATTPKVGFIYDPNADFTVKGSWGKSFKAPTLKQLYWSQNVYLYDVGYFGGTGAPGATALTPYGGNRYLTPERARSWTASLAFHPEAVSGLDAELSWFDIKYTKRVAVPFRDWDQIFSNPLYAPFVDLSPTLEKQAALLAAAPHFYNYASTAYDPSKVMAIVYAQYANLAGQHVQGLDLTGSYRFDVGSNHLTVRGSTSWQDSTQQNTPMQKPYALAGTIYNPAKVNSRAGVVWNRGGTTASLFANYTGGVTNPADGRKTASFTTFDAVLRYATQVQAGLWSGWDFSLSVQNLLDRNPPLNRVSWPTYVPYDSTNYSAIGRFVSVSAAKHW